MKFLKKYILILSVLFAGICAKAETGQIIVVLNNISSNNGEMHIALFSSKDGFPGKSNKALKVLRVGIKNNSVKVKFTNIEHGNYAVAIYHDENSNKKFDRHWYFVPKEGWGVSKNIKPTMGPPNYEDAEFLLKADSLELIIKTYY